MREISLRSIPIRGAKQSVTSVSEKRVLLGHEAESGKPFSLPFDAWKAGVTTVGSVGAGKTSSWRRFLYTFGLRTNFLHLDYAGTGHRFFLHWIAVVSSLCAWMERKYPDKAAGMTRAFLSRFAFLTIDETGTNPVRFDLLKRRHVRALDRWEPITAVVNRVFLGLQMKRNEDSPQQLVQLRRIGSAMLTLLIAAERPISEIPLLIDRHDDYYAALNRWLDSATLRYDADRIVVREARLAIDDLRRLSPHQYRLETMSTRNAFDDFAPGKLLGMLFSDDAFPIQELAFGNRCLSVASTVTDPVLRGQAYQLIMGMFHSTVEGRKADKTVCVMADEIGHFSRMHPDTLSRSRNFNVSYFHAYQGEEQWRQLGLAEMPTLIRKLTSLDIRFRPTDFDAAKDLALHTKVFNPGDAFIETMTHGQSTANGVSRQLTDSWGHALSSSDTTSSDSSYGGSDAEGATRGRSIRGEDEETRNESASRTASSVFGNRFGSSSTQGSTATTGGSSSRGESHTITEMLQQVLHRITCDEQAFIEAQKILRTPDRRAYVTAKGITTAVDMLPAAELPAELFGVPVAENLQRWHDGYWRTQLTPREAFDPSITLETIAASSSPSTPAIIEVAPVAMPARSPDTPLDLAVFPSPALELDGDARRLGLLSLVATVRLCTVFHMVAITGWSYDRCYRELDRLARTGFVDRVKPYAPRGEGSAPHIYILTAEGAQRLANAGAGPLPEFQRIAKNLAVFRRTLEANRPVQRDHRLWSSLVATLLIAGARVVDPSAYATTIRFDRERSLSVDLTSYASHIDAKHRPLISPDPTKLQVPLLPDASFLLHCTRRGEQVTHAVIAEVETGFGERPEKDLAIAKSWKMRALADAFARDRMFDGAALTPTSELRSVVWCRTAALEQRFFDGATTVFGDARSPLWITSGDVMPLSIPTATKKRDIAAAAAALVQNVQSPIWRWLRYPDPARRCRFIGTDDGKR